MASNLRAVRGATTLDADTTDQVRTRTQALVRQILADNDVANDDIVSMIFTTTSDVTALFPATAARELGLDDVALLGALEANVVGAPALCVRVLMHFYSRKSKDELRHVYQEGAARLRPDLVR